MSKIGMTAMVLAAMLMGALAAGAEKESGEASAPPPPVPAEVFNPIVIPTVSDYLTEFQKNMEAVGNTIGPILGLDPCTEKISYEDFQSYVINDNNNNKEKAISFYKCFALAFSHMKGSSFPSLSQPELFTFKELYHRDKYNQPNHRDFSAHFPEYKKKISPFLPQANVWDKGSKKEPENVSTSTPPTQSEGSLESMIINGMAQFIATRTKAELVLALQENLATQLCDKDSGKYYFFPNLCTAFKSMDMSITLQAMGAYLHAAALKDLKNVPDAAFALETYRLQNGIYNEQAKKKEIAACSEDTQCQTEVNKKYSYLTGDTAEKTIEILTASRLGFSVLREIENGREPKDIFKGLSELEPLLCEGSTSNDFKETFKAFNVKLKCGTPEMVRSISLLYRIGELFQEKEKKRKADKDAGIMTLDQLPPAYYRNFAILEAAFVFEKSINTWRHGRGKEYVLPAETVSQFVTAENKAEELFKQIDLANQQFVGLYQGNTAPEPEKIIRVSLNAVSKIVNSLSQLFDALPREAMTPEERNQIQQQFAALRATLDFAESCLRQDSAGMAVAVFALANELKIPDSYLPEEVKRLLPVFAEVANAKSSDEVARVIDAAAAPVGSYRMKYKNSMVSLSALVGGGGGTDFILGEEKSGHTRQIVFTVSSPVGLHFTGPFELGKYKLHGGAMVSLVDFGPLLSFGFGGDSDVKKDPDVTLEDILAPGFYFTLGVCSKLPVIIGAGAAYVPNLVVKDGDEEKESAAVRVQAFVGVDVTIFPLGQWKTPNWKNKKSAGQSKAKKLQ